MTRNIRMAREAGWTEYSLAHPVEVARLERFAALVAAAEREACAKVVEVSATTACDVYGEPHLLWCAKAIRARGQE